MHRREAIKLTVGTAASIAIFNHSNLFAESFVSKRPPAHQRKFVSEAVEAKIAEVRKRLGDTELAWLFGNCFPNTLDTTVRYQTLDGRPDAFVITGDIPAMWLRDSSAQVWPYLPLAKEDAKLRDLVAGVINRQTRSILIDPYANAFNFGSEGGEWKDDLTAMKPELHERKWEIDSLCYPIRLAHEYARVTNDVSPFDARWKEAMRLVLKTFREQQRFDGRGPYSFRRKTTTPNDTLNLNGFGNPVRPCGLIASGFRPSDDACIYPFLIPSNLFAVVSLRQLHDLAQRVHDDELAKNALGLSDQVHAAVMKFGVAQHPKYGQIYAYEVDGFGNQLFMDDANVPSLLALPYLGAANNDDPVYRNTRTFVLSEDNPYFFKGKAAEGIGGPHIGMNMVWPLSIIVRGLTANDKAEMSMCLSTLQRTHAGTGFMHESFDKDDPAKFTRPWFAWANTLFGELVLKSLA
ncbi:MAG TPA: glycoside hydrolase family 125 protein [Terriglobales bacterium]|nr:glycoside hydrolase family 125 protein [Terriglobales bacterium]